MFKYWNNGAYFQTVAPGRQSVHPYKKQGKQKKNGCPEIQLKKRHLLNFMHFPKKNKVYDNIFF